MTQSKQERLSALKDYLSHAERPVSGDDLAKHFNVSRQVIVGDISLLRAKNVPITSTNRGYMMEGAGTLYRVFKCKHRDDQIVDELNLIVDLGAKVENVYVEHRIYGKVEAEMNIKSRKDVRHFMDTIYDSVSTPLKNITNGYHFHTISAEDEETLEEVRSALDAHGFLVKE